MNLSNKHTISLLMFLFIASAIVPFAEPTVVIQDAIPIHNPDSKETTLAFADHDPIWINGNEDLITQASNEGWQGDGSEGNPFLITGYFIRTTTINPFKIWNTDLHWEIRGNNVTTDTVFCGTWITNTTHGIIADNIFHGLHSGMVVMYASGLTIENNIFRNTTASAIDIYDWLDNSTIRNNLIYDVAYAGITSPDSTNVHIYNNTIARTNGPAILLKSGQDSIIENNNISSIYSDGIRLDRSCNGNIVRYNLIQDARNGISCVSEFNFIHNNTIRDSQSAGIKIAYSSYYDVAGINNTVSNNIIINSTQYSVDIDEFCTGNIFTGNDFFESGYPVHTKDDGSDNIFSKNFYDSWIVPDDDSDGYVDNPYNVDGTSENQDQLPLAEPYNPIPDDYEYIPNYELPTTTTSTTTTTSEPTEPVDTATSTSTTTDGDSPELDLVPIAVIAAVIVVLIIVIVKIKES